ncbi:Hypothetical protein CINCED_3A007505 [Cinara cedri]|uniref:Uncharacterized protein n=1 Tax=Cinara cedri TaxID=506608 RepID=A0A5E4MAT2_9HEMI|nr:Hypothetical protein CINCED_3A007505 [Cinara cedri]
MKFSCVCVFLLSTSIFAEETDIRKTVLPVAKSALNAAKISLNEILEPLEIDEIEKMILSNYKKINNNKLSEYSNSLPDDLKELRTKIIFYSYFHTVEIAESLVRIMEIITNKSVDALPGNYKKNLLNTLHEVEESLKQYEAKITCQKYCECRRKKLIIFASKTDLEKATTGVIKSIADAAEVPLNEIFNDIKQFKLYETRELLDESLSKLEDLQKKLKRVYYDSLPPEIKHFEIDISRYVLNYVFRLYSDSKNMAINTADKSFDTLPENVQKKILDKLREIEEYLQKIKASAKKNNK